MKTATWVLACVPALCAQSPYAGSEACAACHPEQYRGFRTTAMARSLAPISLRAAPEFQTPVQFSHPRTGSHFRVFHEGSDFVIEEFLPPSAGDLSYSDLRKVSFAIGSGNHARSYLVERAGRRAGPADARSLAAALPDLRIPGVRANAARLGIVVSRTTQVTDVGSKLWSIPDWILFGPAA